MKFNDIITYAFKNIGFKGLRSWLTILGIVIGIAAVVGLTTYGDNLTNQMTSQISTFGAETITVTAGAATRATEMRFNPGGGGARGVFVSASSSTESPALTDDDVSVLQSVSGLSAVSPLVSEHFDVSFNDMEAALSVNFVKPSEYEKIETIELYDGDFIGNNDNMVVIGYSVARDVFDSDSSNNDDFELSVGDMININGTEYKVSGILAEAGFGGNDRSLILDINEAGILIDEWDESYDSIEVKAGDIDDIESLIEVIEDALRVSREVEVGSEDFMVSSMVQMMDTVTEMLDTLSMFLTGIAAISLLVGAISIANTMYTSVFERTREIGIMKALGADDSEVKWLFITESGIISLIGGLGGVVIGLILANVLVSAGSIVTLMPGRMNGGVMSFSFDPAVIAGSLLFSLLIGVLSGYFPAKRAANLNPIEAIWYE